MRKKQKTLQLRQECIAIANFWADMHNASFQSIVNVGLEYFLTEPMKTGDNKGKSPADLFEKLSNSEKNKYSKGLDLKY